MDTWYAPKRGDDQGARSDPEWYPKTGVFEPCHVSSHSPANDRGCRIDPWTVAHTRRMCDSQALMGSLVIMHTARPVENVVRTPRALIPYLYSAVFLKSR